MYLDICHTVPGKSGNGTRRFVDPKTVEILFLNEVVDNPSNTVMKYNHHWVPMLGMLPAAFSSRGSILNGDEIVECLLEEHALHSEQEEYLLLSFPRGSDILISCLIGEVLDYLLYENERIFQGYTAPLLRSVYWPNLVFGYWQSWSIREAKLAKCRLSSAHSASDCIKRLEEFFSLLSHAVDVTESMKLPLRISSKLFALISVLLMIPLEKDPDLAVVAEMMNNSPQFATLAKWCDRTNDACKVWPSRSLTLRRNKTETKRTWREWFGWTAPPTAPKEESSFVPVKSNNILFAMASVGAVFVLLARSRD